MLDKKNIIIALDYNQADAAFALADQLDPQRCRLKVGKELFTSAGPDVVKGLQQRGFDVFLDLKFHDIPNTVAKAVAAAAELGVWMVNVHAQGGAKMLQAAVDSLASYGKDRPLLIAVTILTSMSAADLQALGLAAPKVMVEKLAKLTADNGLDGVVCSAQEAAMIKQLCGKDFLTVTPGIRPKGSAQGDQQRILTPAQAMEQGADYLVVGRPITQSADPLAALNAIYNEVHGT